MNTAIVVATIVLLIQGTRIVIRPGALPYVRCFGAAHPPARRIELRPVRDPLLGRGRAEPGVRRRDGPGALARPGDPRHRIRRRRGPRPARAATEGRSARASGRAALPGPGGGHRLGHAHRAAPTWGPRRRRRPALLDLFLRPLVAPAPDLAERVLPGRRHHHSGCADRRVRTGMFLAMLLVLSWRAQSRQAFTDPRSADLWSLAFYLAALGGLLLVLWLVWSASIGFAGALPRLRAGARGALPAARRQWDRAMTDGWPGISAHVWRGLQPMAGQTPGGAGPRDDRREPHRHLLPGLAAPCGRSSGPRDRVDMPRRGHGAGPAQGVRRQRRAGGLAALARQESWLRQAWLLLSGHFAGPLSQLGAALRRLVSLRPFPEALMKIGVLLVVMMVAYEVPHAGKTLLQPFTAFAVKSNAAEVPSCRFNRTSAARSSIIWSTCSVL